MQQMLDIAQKNHQTAFNKIFVSLGKIKKM